MDDNRDSDDRLRDLPEWLEEFADYLEDTEVQAPAHMSQDSDSERPTKVVSKSRKHSIRTHFPKDRNCEVCLRTKMTRAPCRRRTGRTGEALLRAGKFGDFITADHKVLNEDGESRNNHPHAVVVQDLVTRWIQFYPCKTKTSQETEKSLRKFLEPLAILAQAGERAKVFAMLVVGNAPTFNVVASLTTRLRRVAAALPVGSKAPSDDVLVLAAEVQGPRWVVGQSCGTVPALPPTAVAKPVVEAWPPQIAKDKTLTETVCANATVTAVERACWWSSASWDRTVRCLERI